VQAHQSTGRVGMAMAHRRHRQLSRRVLRIDLRIMEFLLMKRPESGWILDVPYSKTWAEGINR
jgi:hypothetical protein